MLFRPPAHSARTRRRASPAARRSRSDAPSASGCAPAPARVKLEMIALEHARLFGGKPELVLLGLERVDALEQRLVQIGVVARRARTGAISRSIACNSSLVAAPVRLKKTPPTRSRLRPLRSSASIVLAKVGGAGFAAIASTSRRASFSAASKAARKWPGSMRSNGGASNGPVQGSRSGILVEVRIRHKAIMLL